jgi:paraquat-inducible protein A
LVLSTVGRNLHTRHRAITYQLVEFTGRWGMLDVLLVAILVATLKLGDLVDVAAGSAAFMFTGCVLLSLIATATFNPRALWPSGDEPLPMPVPDKPSLGENA